MKSYDVGTISSMAWIFAIYGALSWIYFCLFTFTQRDMHVDVVLFPLANIAMFGSIFCVSLYRVIVNIFSRFEQYEKRIAELEVLIREKQ